MSSISEVTVFEVGDVVDVKRFGRATVVEPLQTDSTKQFFERYKVQYLVDGKTYYCRPEIMRKVKPASKRVVVCETTQQYRVAAIQNTEPEDCCLEVGCHEGVTTAMISARCKCAVGIDKSEVTVKAARSKFPNMHFEVADAFDVEYLKSLSPTGRFDKVFVDIGGIAELPTVLSLAGLYFREFRESGLVFKSIFMKRFLQASEVFTPNQNSNWVQLDEEQACT